MSYVLLEGKIVSDHIKGEVKKQVEEFLNSQRLPPGLAFIRVGEDPPSKVYVKTKAKSCKEVGIYSHEVSLPENISEKKLLDHIEELNGRPDIHGILVQHPLPKHINESLVYESIRPEKDVDGFHPFNMGKLLLGDSRLVPCTPLGILEILKWYKINVSGTHVVVLGRSNIVGKPAAALLFQKGDHSNATVTVCHSATRNLSDYTRKADILIAAIGKAKFVKSDMVSQGVVVIDVGINRIEDPSLEKGYRLVGDVDFDEVAPKSKAITPVPGGIGLMTVVMLLKNTVRAAWKASRFSEVKLDL